MVEKGEVLWFLGLASTVASYTKKKKKGSILPFLLGRCQ